MQPEVIREAPAPEPVGAGVVDPAFPNVNPNAHGHVEPVLQVENIQGNILGGFSKDHQMLLFLQIRDTATFKSWLKTQIPFIATAGEVLAFNRLFRSARKRRGREGTVKATWTNVALTFAGLQKLQIPNLNQFQDQGFVAGMANRAGILGDHAAGLPENWLVGRPGEPVHLVFIVAADDYCDLVAEVERIERSIADFRVGPPDGWVRILFVDEGRNLPPPLSGHEHFGFLDGVSQPGLRGRISDISTDVLTPRQNPDEPDDQGKPGQDLLWPGEFVFGYPTQIPTPKLGEEGLNTDPGPISQDGPDWTRDGSYLVFRRLRQDVGGFHAFLKETAANLGVEDPPNSSAAQLVGSRLVGRWPSGTPTVRQADQEDQSLGDDDCANNDFEFGGPSAPIVNAPSPSQCTRKAPVSPGDLIGVKCPFTGHIRKTYPRDDTSASIPGLNESSTQTHRLLRRGIPYGPVSRSTVETPFRDETDRGLHFLAYQTSIQRQFEFVTAAWVNNPDFKEPFDPTEPDPTKRGGHDPIIGQNPAGPREFTVTFPDPAGGGAVQAARVTTHVDWIIPTGGEYFFAPSLKALENTLT